MDNEPDLTETNSKKGEVLEKKISSDELTTKEITNELSSEMVILNLNQITQEIINHPKKEFCKYLGRCDGADTNCFYPYKTKGCHKYQNFEKNKNCSNP